MHAPVAHLKTSFPAIRIVLIVVITFLSSGWTCAALFVSCQGVGSLPHITSLSPDGIPGNVDSAVLTVEGSGFSAQSQIMWNETALPTRVLDQQQLQTTITGETLESLGVRPGSSVQISARSHGTDISGCPTDGTSNFVFLVII
jgi:hypothetical protein